MKITCMILLAGSLSSCAGAPAEPQQTADAPVAMAFASEEVSLRSAAGAVPYTPLSSHPVELVITLADGREVSAEGYDLKFSSADAAVAVVDNGRIEAVGEGETVVRASLGDLSASIGVSVTPAGVSTTGVGEFDADNIYSKGVYLVRNTVMQGFDIDSDGSIWYMQLGGSDKHDLYVMHARRGESPAERMIFRYSGHGTNMAVEQAADGKTYIWTGTYASRNASNDYWSNSVVTRTEFVDGATVLPEQCGDLFYLGGICELHPAIDAAGDVLARPWRCRAAMSRCPRATGAGARVPIRRRPTLRRRMCATLRNSRRWGASAYPRAARTIRRTYPHTHGRASTSTAARYTTSRARAP